MQRSAPHRPQANEISESTVSCPFLGSSTQSTAAVEFPSDTNKCYSNRLAIPISTIHQENYCLSPNFDTCPVYRERSARATGAPLLPLTATVGAANLDNMRAMWPEPDDGTVPVATAGAASAAAMATPARAPYTWEETPHPDFQADMAAASARRYPRSRQVNLRPVLLGLLLLALIPLAWWLWTTVRPGPRSTAESVEGTVVTLPTLMATPIPGNNGSGNEGIAAASPQGSPVAGGVGAGDPTLPPAAQPTAEPTLSDLERIALTATALFANATPVSDCAAPSWWVAYTVEAGDTIDALATTRGILPQELIVANCLAGNELAVGTVLMLPPVGVIVIQPATETPTPTPTATNVRPTSTTRPTRAPILFPTPTFPVIIILTPQLPTAEPTEPPPTEERPVRPTTAPTSAVQPTATAPNPFPTATAPNIFPTSTPPVFGGSITPTPTGTAGAPTQTPPSP